ncbi:PX domain protein [Dictyocaulus viviparus]|uniref:PX domain protein n=1 Tax=Dictyocaulus viviparus TaxID=29172 RepID=A0A0D8XNI9_DICVI|nr:PX domain protein [Dictyocaulus viviparus]
MPDCAYYLAVARNRVARQSWLKMALEFCGHSIFTITKCLSLFTDDSVEHRLSVQDATTLHSHPQSRATSESRTDLSTDEDVAQHTVHMTHYGKRRSSAHASDVKSCEFHRHSRNNKRTSAHKCRPYEKDAGNCTNIDKRAAISRSHSAGGTERQGSSKVNRNINRFSNFVKSGMEAYILGESRMSGQSGEKHEVVISGPLIQWRPIQQYYTCTVDKPKKETKLKGLKSFIAYSLTSSLSRIQVSRRYKHFDWLHDQLSAKYIMIAIPPLPEKQVSGRYEDDLIDHRKHILQLWVNKICRHPVLSHSEVWLHFITCTDEKEWKNGKRRAEKDEYVGGNFLNCVTVPQSPLDISHVERQMDKFQRSVKTTEDSMRLMQERLTVFQKLFVGPVKSNWQKMASTFVTLAQSFHIDDHPGSNRMVEALKQTAHHYHKIGDEFEHHSRNDMEPVVESLYSFKGTIQTAPDIMHVHKQAIQKYRENEGKLSHADAERIKRRVDSTSYAVLAEMNHLNTEKIEDVRLTMYNYLKRQADFYQKLANTMNDMAKLYEF